jgi:hypothetical protein
MREDAELPLAELDARDREIGKVTAKHKSRPLRQLWSWIQSIDTLFPSRSIAEFSNKVVLSVSIISSILIFLGAVSGMSAIFALCQYDGNRPVNIVFLLGFYFLVQAVSLTLFIVSMFPGLVKMTDRLSRMNIGYVLSQLISHFPGPWRELGEGLFGKSGRHYAIFGRMQKWVVLYFSQIFSTAFYFGSLVGFVLLVSLSDLAFSWSSTLKVSSLSVLQVTDFLSWPWREHFSQAVPTLQLIDASRYYRLESGVPATDAYVFGLWWPFVAMCLFVYGFLPRVFMWCLSYYQLIRVSKKTAFLVPGVSDVLERMNNASVSLSDVQGKIKSDSDSLGELQELHPLQMTQRSTVFNWASARPNVSEFFNSRSQAQVDIFEVGGSQSTSDDQAVLNSFASELKDQPILIVVKAWEPPRGDFLDFMEKLRAVVGDGKTFHIIPLSHSESPPSELHLRAWQSSMKKSSDPWIKLCRLESS